MATDIRAKAGSVPLPAQKVRLVVDLIRGKSVQQASDTLTFVTTKPAHYVTKLLNSAIANAETNMGISRNELYVAEIMVDEGPTRKWRRFGARGRFKPWLKRSSIITIVLRETETSPVA
jgi:large subunit ribosomal protein L22